MRSTPAVHAAYALFDHAAPYPMLAGYARAHVAMRFTYARELRAPQWERYLGFYGVDAALQGKLRPLCDHPDAFLYTGTSVMDPSQNRTYADLQLATIRRLRERGVLPSGVPIAFKGHPANPDLEPEVMRALGDDIVHIPARVPLEVLQMAGLLPSGVGGVVSSSYLTLDPRVVRFIFGHPIAFGSAPVEDTAQLLVACGLIDPARVFSWLD